MGVSGGLSVVVMVVWVPWGGRSFIFSRQVSVFVRKEWSCGLEKGCLLCVCASDASLAGGLNICAQKQLVCRIFVSGVE